MDTSRDRAEALLQERALPKARCSGKVLLVLSLLTGLGLTVFLGHAADHGPAISMASQYMQPMKAQILQPAKISQAATPARAWQSMQPARVQQFRRTAVSATSKDGDAALNNPILASRRGALASGLAAAAMIPAVVQGATPERSVLDADDARATFEKLEAQKKAAAEKKAARRAKAEAEAEEEKEGGGGGGLPINPVTGALGISFLSVPFFFPNLQRLATKILSGGEDDGYDDPPPPKNSRRTVTGRRGPR